MTAQPASQNPCEEGPISEYTFLACDTLKFTLEGKFLPAHIKALKALDARFKIRFDGIMVNPDGKTFVVMLSRPWDLIELNDKIQLSITGILEEHASLREFHRVYRGNGISGLEGS